MCRPPKKTVARKAVARAGAESTFKVEIKTISERPLKVEVSDSTTISFIKQQIKEHEKIPVASQSLSYLGKTLTDNKTVVDYGMENLAVLRLKMKKKKTTIRTIVEYASWSAAKSVGEQMDDLPNNLGAEDRVAARLMQALGLLLGCSAQTANDGPQLTALIRQFDAEDARTNAVVWKRVHAIGSFIEDESLMPATVIDAIPPLHVPWLWARAAYVHVEPMKRPPSFDPNSNRLLCKLSDFGLGLAHVRARGKCALLLDQVLQEPQ